ncbi:MAG TPA: hypothetical protein VMV60_02285, partial [Thermoanaerobaculia bacterium]|nr:hypothetical protein [Thermoanaerobaculia bacterium]
AVIVGETKEKRISFYFSRPIPSGAIWAGKLLAAIFITLAAALVALTPGWLSGNAHARSLWGFDATPGNTALAALVMAVVAVLASHAAVTVARLRSPWVVLDLILGPALVLLAGLFLRFLIRFSRSQDFDVTSPAIVAAGFLAATSLLSLFAASLAQVAEGRTDARRAHGAFSVVLFGLVGAAVALVGCYAGWCASAKATDLAEVWGGVQTAPHGWLVAGGPLRAWRGGGTFLFDPASGRSLRTRSRVTFSQDGTRAAWEELRFGFFERKESRSAVLVADLVSGRSVETGLECGTGWCRVLLSPSGSRLAIVGERGLTAYDVSTPENPKELAAFRVDGDVTGAAFVGEDTIRLFPRISHLRNVAQTDLGVAELALPSKKFLLTGRFDRESLPFLRLSADARYLVGTRRTTDDPRGTQALTLHDGRTGALVATLAEELQRPQARFLTGGRIAVAGIAGTQARVIFFEGEKGWAPPSRSVDLGPAGRVALGGEIAPGRVAVALLPFEENRPPSRRAWTLAFVDAATGAVSPGPEGLVPADRFGWWSDPTLPPAEAGSPASLLFLDTESRLVRLDPATGAQTVVLGKGK